MKRHVHGEAVIRAAHALMAVTLLAAPFTAFAQPVGFTPGNFQVSATGAAQYSIPIAIPPGTAGVQPKVALTYSSQGGNGLLGQGWNLEGLSVITRCAPTTAQGDGFRGGVTHTSDDRFCLDGQRLMVVSGTYGAASSEYRTERETFAKITASSGTVSYGACPFYSSCSGGNGTMPQSFTVKTKAGLSMEYGVTGDSRIEAAGSGPIRIWALNKVTDSKGNYFTVSYEEDGTNGDFRPEKIEYTGNAGQSVSPYASVRFEYATRSGADVPTGYHAGALLTIQKRLTNVKTYLGTSTLVMNYQLAYDNNGAAGMSRVTSITQCDASSNCLPATTFSMQAQPTVAYTPTATSVDNCTTNCDLWYAGDFNGDGRTDYVHIADNSGNVYTWLATTSGFTKVADSDSNDTCLVTPSCGTWLTGDVNGDGKTDLIHMTGHPGDTYRVVTWMSDGDGTYTKYVDTDSTDTVVTSGMWRAGDVNGDGRTDLLHFTPTTGQLSTWISAGDGTYTAVIYSATLDTSCNISCGQWFTGEVNGDGRVDVVHVDTSSGKVYSWLSNGSGTYTEREFVPGSSEDTDLAEGQWLAGDINGDGKTDFFHTRSSGTHWSWISKGDGNFVLSSYADSNGNDSVASGTWQAGDVNGDGKTDFFHVAGFSVPVYTWISKGNGQYDVIDTSTTDTCLDTGCGPWMAGDVNGDGRADFVRMYLAASSSQFMSWLAPTPGTVPADFLAQVTSGLGATTTLAYKPLTDAGIYTKDTSATYPKVDLQMPMYVASTVTASNGVGGTVSTTYKYGGAKLDLTGRGFLGFLWSESTDGPSGIAGRTQFSSDWPYIGLPLEIKKTKVSSGVVLSEIDNTYACRDFDGSPSTCNSSLFFPYVASSTHVQKDLSGTAISTVVTTNADVDAYGNFGTITVNTDSDTFIKVTTNIYENDATNWILGRLTKSTVASTAPDTPSSPPWSSSPSGDGGGGGGSVPLDPAVLMAILQLLLDD